MKTKLILLILCFFMFGCKKNPFDYRTKYLGDYIFVVHNSSWNPTNGQFDTTYTVDGNVDYVSDKNSVLISSPTFSLQATVYEDGTLEGYWNNNGEGEFESTKKIKYHCGYYWPGGQSNSYITGEKK